ncbi:hypothetical protein MRX96_008477 [Rhipicephalus microplus]
MSSGNFADIAFSTDRCTTELPVLISASKVCVVRHDLRQSQAYFWGEPNVFTQEEASSAPASSSELLACIRARKPAEECEAFLDTGESNFDELLSDLQTFVAFGASVDGQASTQEVLAAFKHKVQGGTSAPVFKALLSKICEFHRQEDGQGVWKLRPEFR